MRYAQTEQYAKANNFADAVLEMTESEVIDVIQSVDLDPWWTAMRQVWTYTRYVKQGQVYTGVWQKLHNGLSFLRAHLSETTTSKSKSAPLFNIRGMRAVVHSILIEGLPREWETNGQLEEEEAYEALFLANYGVAYDSTRWPIIPQTVRRDGVLHTPPDAIDRSKLRLPPGPTRPWATVAWYNSLPDSDVLAASLYGVWEPVIPYASL